jgi:hypothetical protein
MGGEMCFFLVLFWYSGVVDDSEAHTVFAVIPRFGEFNSRLGGREFPVRFTTGIRGQGLDLLDRFCKQTTVARGKSTIFPFRRENQQFCPLPVALQSTLRGPFLPCVPVGAKRSCPTMRQSTSGADLRRS